MSIYHSDYANIKIIKTSLLLAVLITSAELTENIKSTFVISNNLQHKFCKKKLHRFKSLRKNADCNYQKTQNSFAHTRMAVYNPNRNGAET